MIRRLFMTGLGLGYAPVASGTFGSAGAAAIAFLFWLGLSHAGISAAGMVVTLMMLTLVASIGCVVWGQWAVAYFGERSRKKGDPGQVVIDEFAGQWLALLALPMTTFGQTVAVFAVQFFLFRLFDVLKPSPGRQLEKLSAGWGILLDDLSAGIYANVIGQVVFRCLVGS